MGKNRVLFVCKKREISEQWNFYSDDLSTGLFNSVKFISDMLTTECNIENKFVQVIDNNCIDKEVTAYKPTHVIIEALWVVPNKFRVLATLHPEVQWIVRLHSETSFLANEGIAMEWLFDYVQCPNVKIACNSDRLKRELDHILRTECVYMPNFYPLTIHNDFKKHDHDTIRIGCFGAIRPLKNQLIQAYAAIKYAEKVNKKLYFYINATRIELQGNSILKNIKALFRNVDHHLLECEWMPHPEFKKMLAHMDIGLQVSFTETYNIVAADCVDMNVPVVTSSEVKFVAPSFHADPTNIDDIVHKMDRAYNSRNAGQHRLNKVLLEINSKMAKRVWIKYLEFGEIEVV